MKAMPAKNLPLKSIAVVVIFATGYFLGSKVQVAGSLGATEKRERGGTGKVEGLSESSFKRERRSPDRGHASKLVLPFAPGGARDWLFEQAKVPWDSDPAASLRVIQRCIAMDESSLKELLHEMIAIRVSEDPELRAKFRGRELDGILKASVFRLSQLDPDAAFRLLDEAGAPGGELLSLVFSNIAAENMGKAREHLKSVDPADLRDAIEPVAAMLFIEDPAAAILLLEDHPQPELDSERRKLVERIVASDPERGVAVAVKFARDGRNPDVIRAAVARWMSVDQEAAVKWTEAYTGPGDRELRDFLLKQQTKGR